MTTSAQPMTDPVCGMAIDDPANTVGSSDYMGRTYYFCSDGCKQQFDANPAQFATA